MEFAEVVAGRRMVRNFRSDPVPIQKLERILRMARKAPSAGFSQGQSFVVVRDESRRQQIARIAGEQRFVGRGFDPWLSRAPVHIVCCTSEAAYHERYRAADKLDEQGKERPWPVPFWFVDAGCTLMLLLLAAVDEGLAAGFLRFDEAATAALRELLGIPADVAVIGVVTLGLSAPDRRSKSLERGWREEASVIRWERWS